MVTKVLICDAACEFIGGITPGSWAEWFGAIFTSAAFLIAAVALLRDVTTRRSAQARLVYAELVLVKWVQPKTSLGRPSRPHGGDATVAPRFDGVVIFEEPTAVVTVKVHNLSQELTAQCDVRAHFSISGSQGWDVEMQVGSVSPHGSTAVDLYCRNRAHPGEPSVSVEVRFRDASGRWWRRLSSDPVKPMRCWEARASRHPVVASGR